MTCLFLAFSVGIPLLFGLFSWLTAFFGFSEEEFTEPRPPAERSAPVVTAFFGGLFILSAASSLALYWRFL